MRDFQKRIQRPDIPMRIIRTLRAAVEKSQNLIIWMNTGLNNNTNANECGFWYNIVVHTFQLYCCIIYWELCDISETECISFGLGRQHGAPWGADLDCNLSIFGVLEGDCEQRGDIWKQWVNTDKTTETPHRVSDVEETGRQWKAIMSRV